MEKKLRVLFLPKWYPNRYDPMPGLFIQRQAEAVTPFCDVAVIYVHPDPQCPNALEAEFSEENQVRVLRVYCRVRPGKPSVFGKIMNLWNFYKSHKKAFHSIRQFHPDVVHAHILTRMGFIGWRLASGHRIPLVISEHWSRYYPENNTYRGWLRKLVTRFVVGRADAMVAVSEPLRAAMQQCNLNSTHFRVIPNVVSAPDPAAEIPGRNPEVKTIVHISCFEDKSKNISGFLRSVKELSLIRQDFKCLMVGAGPDFEDMKDYAGFLRVKETFVQFTGVKTGREFDEILCNADFSVLSSHYETFGTVVIESLACGVPVVSTRVGVAGEVISDANGLLVPPDDEPALTDAMNRMLDMCRKFDKSVIRGSISDRYSSDSVGRQIAGLYNELVITPH